MFSRCSARCIHHARCLHTRLGSTRLAPRLARACPNVRTAHDHVKRDCLPAAAVTCVGLSFLDYPHHLLITPVRLLASHASRRHWRCPVFTRPAWQQACTLLPSYPPMQRCVPGVVYSVSLSALPPSRSDDAQRMPVFPVAIFLSTLSSAPLCRTLRPQVNHHCAFFCAK